ncbi:MAG: 2-oxoacid:acceptor oxidoreductase family protein [Coriobacteriales bacterium]|nr:2-oxoacid:acceptor oxidoreductase family protein [Coriobacteriales bacterium]MDD6738817.1 2-oxoacid:acceptor oxidoreductase family protein [Coriobacteriaceae bacterium]MDD6768529.1 2-oxoacid:acceptor oxidoreductase family protein [Coriobacteriaceae bacterium]
MSQLTEIRWHARAGQGAVTAAKLVAETALSQGRYMQAMPEYGPERAGAPLKAFTRVCDEPIEVHNNVTNPAIVVVLDDTLLPIVDVTEGILPGGHIILNTKLSPAQVREQLKVADDITVATVDASGIALDTIKRDIPNAAIVAAVVKVTGVVPLEEFKAHFESSFAKKELVPANMEAIDRAYEEVQQ